MATHFTPFFQALDGNGDPYSGALLYFYRTGTSTLLDTYTTSALTTANANPVVADSAGRFGPIYFGTSYDYKAVLKTAAGATIDDFDPIFASSTAGRVAVADAAYALTAPDRLIAYTSISAARSVSLLGADNYTAGTRLVIVDESGSANHTKTISIAPDGSDTINGLNTTQVVISSAYGSVELESDGSSKWTIIRNTDGRRAVADAATTVTARDSVISYTSISTSRTVTLPAATAYPAGKRLTIVDESGSVTQAIQISIAPNGSDTIAGSNTTQVCVNIARARCVLMSNGVDGWTVLEWAVRYVKSLGADVNLNNTSNYFDGPTIDPSQGTVGTWRAYGVVTASSSNQDNIHAKLWDGTTVIDSAVHTNIANGNVGITLAGIITSPAAALKISAKDASNTTGVLGYNTSGSSKDCTLTVERIA